MIRNINTSFICESMYYQKNNIEITTCILYNGTSILLTILLTCFDMRAFYFFYCGTQMKSTRKLSMFGSWVLYKLNIKSDKY